MDVFHIIEFYTRSTLVGRKVATTWQLAQAYVENEEHLCHEWAKATYMWPAEGWARGWGYSTHCCQVLAWRPPSLVSSWWAQGPWMRVRGSERGGSGAGLGAWLGTQHTHAASPSDGEADWNRWMHGGLRWCTWSPHRLQMFYTLSCVLLHVEWKAWYASIFMYVFKCKHPRTHKQAHVYIQCPTYLE